MASTAPRLPEQFRAAPVTDFNVSEFAADQAGSLSPFGTDVEFPLPVEQLTYTHPSPADRPNLADGH
jgi:succinate dehydrogenase / fumarate reductase iron-sulfur subunit